MRGYLVLPILRRSPGTGVSLCLAPAAPLLWPVSGRLCHLRELPAAQLSACRVNFPRSEGQLLCYLRVLDHVRVLPACFVGPCSLHAPSVHRVHVRAGSRWALSRCGLVMLAPPRPPVSRLCVQSAGARTGVGGGMLPMLSAATVRRTFSVSAECVTLPYLHVPAVCCRSPVLPPVFSGVSPCATYTRASGSKCLHFTCSQVCWPQRSHNFLNAATHGVLPLSNAHGPGAHAAWTPRLLQTSSSLRLAIHRGSLEPQGGGGGRGEQGGWRLRWWGRSRRPGSP